MSKPKSATTLLVALVLAVGVAAARAEEAPAAGSAKAPDSAASPGSHFKPYPGAVVYTPPETEDTKLFRDTLRPGMTITAYLSHDSYEKVLKFYRRLGKEYTKGRKSPEKLPGGEEVKKTFVILDGAPDLLQSKTWLSVQHPFVAARQQGVPDEVQDVTEIVLTVKKPVPKDKQKDSTAPQPQ